MERPPYLDPDYTLIKVAGTLEEMKTADFGPGANCILHPRTLGPDFDAVAAHYSGKYIHRLHAEKIEEDFRHAVGNIKQAANQMIEDLTFFQAPALPASETYVRITTSAPPGQMRYHADTDLETSGPCDWQPFIHRAPPMDEWGKLPRLLLSATGAFNGHALCNYNGPATQYLRNDKVGSGSTEGVWHGEMVIPTQFYTPLPDIKPLSFKPGDLWRHAMMPV